ncbi:hypothetical protein predicted by Glimmer/Critica [Helicobacter pylori B8]|uniref:Uncharacterized protein n=1 Tax=Helicobacter pylori (strain B8) TaxID=693745 RepID=D7FG82_HELP3|nr:hypothetical protein predicted by Glimmer/Critica [Helicobacter pylori B8]
MYLVKRFKAFCLLVKFSFNVLLFKFNHLKYR